MVVLTTHIPYIIQTGVGNNHLLNTERHLQHDGFDTNQFQLSSPIFPTRVYRQLTFTEECPGLSNPISMNWTTISVILEPHSHPAHLMSIKDNEINL